MEKKMENEMEPGVIRYLPNAERVSFLSPLDPVLRVPKRYARSKRKAHLGASEKQGSLFRWSVERIIV